MKKEPTLEEMLSAGLHFGHRAGRWHPKMEPYIFTSRKNIHIINLVKTKEKLEEAMNFLTKISQEGKIILFVGTKSQAKEPIARVASELGMPYINEKWIGGLLTNFMVVKKSIKKYNDLVRERESGKLNKYTKKERLEFDREIERLELKFKGVSGLAKMPDALFIWDIKKEDIAISEAKKKNIPTIGVCDTNVNPELVNYPIPANDDATKGINFVLDMAKDAVEEGHKKQKDNK